MREARDQAGITQMQLAMALGVQQTAVSRWELGSSDPTARRAQRIEEVLGVPRGSIDWDATAASALNRVPRRA